MNNYLLDTNVISEKLKRTPIKEVDDWMNSLNISQVFLSVITIGEIKIGALKSKDEHLQVKILSWLERTLQGRLKNNILPIDLDVINVWANIRTGAGRTLPATDTLLAATALHNGLVMATRNTKDFDIPGLDIINPFNN